MPRKISTNFSFGAFLASSKFALSATLLACSNVSLGQKAWDVSTYPDEKGFQQRAKKVLEPLAAEDLTRFETGYFDLESGAGDPAKYAVPNIIAKLLRNPNDPIPWEYLARGKHAQETYHFAIANMARFFWLYRDRIPERERSRYLKALETTAAIVGDPKDRHLGGGGTENHMTQWRFAGLSFSEMYPELRIGKRSAKEARAINLEHLRRYVKNLYTIGNGEWMSSIYIQFSLLSFLNLYDTAKDPKIKMLARAGLDWHIATYGQRWLRGTLGGAEWRGFATGAPGSITDHAFWLWFGDPSRKVNLGSARYSIHQITSGYRPNRVLTNVVRRSGFSPFTIRNTWPDYFMRKGNQVQETLTVTPGYILGSAQVGVDGKAPGGNQVTPWKLVTLTADGTASFGGGHPYHDGPMGKSPYDQILQEGGTLISSTQIPQEKVSERGGTEVRFFAPASVGEPSRFGDWYVFQTQGAFVGVRPFTKTHQWLAPGSEWRALQIPGMSTGFVVEVAETKEFPGSKEFGQALVSRTRLDGSQRLSDGITRYESLKGTRFELRHQADLLKPAGSINGVEVNWSNWDHAQFSPYVRQKLNSGVLRVWDGHEGYEIDFSGRWPKFRDLPAQNGLNEKGARSLGP